MPGEVFTRQLAHSVQGLLGAVAKIIDYADFEAGFEQGERGVRADVAGAAGEEYVLAMLKILFVFDDGAELRLIDKALLDVYGLHQVVIDAQADVGFGQVFQALDYEAVQGYALPMRQVPAEAAIDGADVDFAVYEIATIGLLAYELVALVFHVAEELVEQI